jgi:glucosamine--fructose-6-phosphate aminotransferase (isomerizing)
MAAEMGEQPEVLRRLVARRDEIIASIRALVTEPPVGIVMVARGSSDYAAIYGRYVIEAAARRPVALAAPSLHTLYNISTDYDGYIAVSVSQSGKTPEIVTVTRRMAATGARTVAITNSPDSPLAEAADVVVPLGAGEERAVPATKTFTSSLLSFSLVAEALGEVSWSSADLEALRDQVQDVLHDGEPARRVAHAIHHANGLVSVGRGFLFPIALEAALKLKETTSLLAEGFSAADLRHGPVAVVQRDFPVLAFYTSGPAQADMEELVELLRDEHGAHVFTATSSPTADLPLPSGVPEGLSPIPAAVRAQQVAHALALIRGLDPDAPPGLSKVTATR